MKDAIGKPWCNYPQGPHFCFQQLLTRRALLFGHIFGLLSLFW